MTTFNTGNPLGSTAVKDLYDNAENFDLFSLSPNDYEPDRFKINRLTLAGIRNQANTALANTGFEEIGDYTNGPLTITRRNQVFTYNGQFYAASAALPLPYTTVNNWATDSPKFVNRGDFVLRQDLAASSGAARIGALSRSGMFTNVQELLNQSITSIRSVREKGAVGDGVTDDTAAFAAAIAEAVAKKSSAVFVPAGNYLVKGDWELPEGSLGFTFYGEGRASRLKFDANKPLFRASGFVKDLSFRAFTIDNTGNSTNLANACFWFPEGNAQTEFVDINLLPDLGANKTCPAFYVCAAGKTNDTVAFTNCVLHVNRMGIALGAGSSVWLTGGRIIGFDPNTEDSVGLLLTGYMGGVYIVSSDIIGLRFGVALRQAAGQPTNREVFLATTAIDSCRVGLSIEDAGSYVSWTGVWAASCDSANINFAPTAEVASLNLCGGTIFNAGALDPSGLYANQGLSVNQFGRLECTGISFRNNLRRGLSCNSGERLNPAIITACHFFANGSDRSGACQAFLAGRTIFKHNVLETSVSPNVSVDSGSASRLTIEDNEGLQGFALRPAPAMPASNVETTNNTGQALTAYFRNGTVTSYWVNGMAVYQSSPGAAVNAMLRIPAGGTFKIIYSAAPDVNWYFE